MKSYDILLAGEPYVFAGRGIELGGAEKEPAPVGQLGSIVISSLHAGLGPARDLAPGRYLSATNAILHKPGLFIPDFNLPAALTSYDRGTPLYPWMLAYEKGAPADYAFVIGPKKIYWFDPHVDSPTLTEVAGSDLATLTGDKCYTGSCFPWNNRWIFGFEDDLKVAAGFTRVAPPGSTATYDASSSANNAGVSQTTLTWAHTVGAGANRLLMVGTFNEHAGASEAPEAVNSVTYGGVALTKLEDIAYGNYGRETVWYLKEADMPAAGAHNIVVTLAAADYLAAGATSWSGAHQGTAHNTPTGTFGTVVNTTAYGKSIAVNVTGAVGDVVHDFLGGDMTLASTPGADQTQRWNTLAATSFISSAGSTQPFVSTETMQWTNTNNAYLILIGAAIKPAAAPGAMSATLVNAAATAMSFGAASRGRVFWTRNKGPSPMEVYWAPQQAVDFEAVGFTKYGPILTDVIRSTWVSLWGGTLFIPREDGSVLGTDETGFVGLAMPAPMRRDDSTSNPMLSTTFGRGATPYLDALLLPSVDTVWGLNPHTLAAKQYDPAALQNTDADFMRSIFLSCTAAGAHGFIGGLTLLNADGTGSYMGRIYRLVPIGDTITAHAFGVDFGVGERVISMFSTIRFDSDRDPTTYLYALTDDGTSVRLYRYTLRTDVNPAGAHPAPAVADPATVTLTYHSGDEMQRNMSKLFLQVRGRVLLPTGGTPKVTFLYPMVDENPVTIADVTTSGEFSTPITYTTTPANRIGRSIKFALRLHGTSIGKALYLPLSIDFLWVPAQHDLLTITVLASAETVSKLGGLWNRYSAKDTVDRLMALRNTIITAEFPAGSTGATTTGTVAWSLFVQNVQAVKGSELTGDVTGLGAHDYQVSLVCRKL
jgi:hypothetical protein